MKSLNNSLFMYSPLLLGIHLTCFVYPILADTSAEGRQWLAENAKKEGVRTFPEPEAWGAQYKILQNGTGLFSSIAPKTRCKVAYSMSTMGGVEVYSSFKEKEYPDLAVTKNMDGMVMGATKPPMMSSQIIRNLYHVIGDMVEGDMWELYFPAELAFDKEDSVTDDRLKGVISPGDVVIFVVELRKLLGEKRRVHDCVLETRTNCLAEELEAMDIFGKDAADVKAEIKRLKSNLQSSEPLKQEVKELQKTQLAFLKKLLKYMAGESKAKAEL